jgi:hypothetical protein
MYVHTLAGVVLGGEAAGFQVEGARRRDVGEGYVRGEGGAGGEGRHVFWLWVGYWDGKVIVVLRDAW